MFTNIKSIIYITKSKIKLVNVTLNKKPKEEVIDEALWMSDSLENILLKFKKNIKGNARILLAEDFVYVITLSFPVGSFVSKDNIREKAQELIPENLTQTVWDYKVATPSTVQVVATVPSLSEKLSEAIVKTGIRIEEIVPLSYALASFAKRQDLPTLFVFRDEEILLILAQKGTVITTKRILNNTIDKNNIDQFITFAKDQFSKEPKIIIFCGDTNNINLGGFQNENLKVEIQNISPIVGLAYKEDLKGKDEDVLNIDLMTILGKGPSAQHLEGGEARPPFGWNRIVGIVLLMAIIAGGFLFFQAKSQTDQTSSKDAPNKSKPTITGSITPKISATPTATSSAEVDFSKYSIRVLNGSGREGEAGRLEAILKDNGFNVTEIGNADKVTYEKTEVRHKKEVPKNVVLALDKILNTLYDFSISGSLEEDTDTDIVIIVGGT